MRLARHLKQGYRNALLPGALWAGVRTVPTLGVPTATFAFTHTRSRPPSAGRPAAPASGKPPHAAVPRAVASPASSRVAPRPGAPPGGQRPKGSGEPRWPAAGDRPSLRVVVTRRSSKRPASSPAAPAAAGRARRGAGSREQHPSLSLPRP